MKNFIKPFGLATGLVLALVGGPVRAQDATDQGAPPSDTSPAPDATTQEGDGSVNFQTFYDQLSNQGTWVQTNQYGNVFQPTESNPNWRPYTYGHWVNTDAGMTWVSDDSFGWATDHYGRWVNLDGYGWVWVPGYTWAPAWVSWRQDADDVGWAPLPPDSDVGIDYYGDNDFDIGGLLGFHIGHDCDTAYGIGPGCYNFCPIAYIGDPYPYRHFRDRRDNFALIGRTRNVTNINVSRDGAGRFGRVHAEGPSVAALNARSRTPIATARLTSASRVGAAGLHGRTLAVYAPRVNAATVKTARPESVSRSLGNVSVNRGTDVNRPLAVNSSIRPATATAAQIHAARVAESNVPASARIATAKTRISHPLTRPLSSFRTATRTASVTTGARENAFTGASHVSMPAVNGESRYAGEAVTPRSAVSSPEESRFTGGEAAVTHEAIAPSAEERYTGEAGMPSHEASTYHSAPAYGGEGYHPTSVYHSSASVYHPEAGGSVYHPQASAPMFHASQPAYHPQASFHSAAPASQPHFGGGGFHSAPAAHFGGGGGGFHAAPAAHVGGGGGGGGHVSGGGAVHASAGGGVKR